MLSTCQVRLRSAVDALAVGGFLILWLTIWPLWLVRNYYMTAPPRLSSRHG